MSSDKTSPGKSSSGPSPLAGLLNHLAEQAPHKYAVTARVKQHASQHNTSARLSLLGEPPEVGYFEKTWSRLSTDLRLRQSQQHVPDNAGPLNSSQLIHRALLLMQDRSPGYLRHFLSYVDTQSWMAQLNANAAPPPAKSAAAKKPARKTR